MRIFPRGKLGFQTAEQGAVAVATPGQVYPVYEYTGQHELIIDDESKGDWRIKFLTSGVFVMHHPQELAIDVFLVGGGGSGANNTQIDGVNYMPKGGNGGRTKTIFRKILANQEYDIVIGAGGEGVTGNSITGGNDGGTTSAFGDSAAGGMRGIPTNPSGINGGSGGGGVISGSSPKAAGGSDGGDGTGGATLETKGGTGQGTTTREFGEPFGALYSSGGGGSTDNTNTMSPGGAGSGGDSGKNSVNPEEYNGKPGKFYGDGGGGSAIGYYAHSGSGHQGIAIIRNHREATA